MFAGIQFIGYLPRAWPLYVCRYPVYRLSTKGLTIVCLQVSSLSAIYQGPDHCMFAGIQFIGYLPRAWPLYVCRYPVYRLSTKGLTIVCLQVSSLSAIYQGPDHCMFAGVQFIGYLPRAWPLYVCRCPVYWLSTKGLTIVCLQVSSLSAIYQGPDHCMFAGIQFIGYLPRAWSLYVCRYPVYRLSTKGLTIVCLQVSSLSAIYQGPDHCMFAGIQFIGYLPRAWPLYVCRCPVYWLSTKGLTIVCLQVSSLLAIYQGPDHRMFAGIQFIGYLPRAWPSYVCRYPVYRLSTKGLTIVSLQVSSLSAIYQGPDHCMFAGVQFIGYLPRAWPLYVCRCPVYRLSTKGLTIVCLQVSSLSAIYQGPDHCMFAGIQFIGYLPRAWPLYVCRYPVYRLSTKGLTIVSLQVSSLSAIYQGPDHCMFAGIQFIGYLPRAWPLYVCRYPVYRLSTKGLTIVSLQVSSLSAIYQGPDHCMFAGIQFIGYLPRAWPLYVCRYPVYRLSTKGLIIVCLQVSSLSAIYQGPDHCMFAGIQFIGYLPRAWPLYVCRCPVYRLSTKGLTIVCLQVSSLSAIYQGPDHCMFAGVQFIGYLPRAWPLYVCRYPVYRLSTKGLTIVCLQVSSLSAIYQGPDHCIFADIQLIGYLPRAWSLYVCRYPVYRLSTKGLIIVCLQVSSLSAIYQGPDHCMFAGIQFIGYLPRAWSLCGSGQGEI